jgi:AraC-like DNA-binding protein
LSNGLTASFVELVVNKPREFKKSPQLNHSGRGYSFVFALTADHIVITGQNRDQALGNFIFASSNEQLHFKILPGRKIRLVIINVTEQWLASTFDGACPRIEHLLEDLQRDPKPILFSTQSSFAVYQAISDMQDHVVKDSTDKFYLKARTVPVLYDVLSNIAWAEMQHLPEVTAAIHTKMVQVEHYLTEYLESSLPCIKTIAREIASSESSLKRNFKSVFGISIYEYYLQKKMQYARQLLDEESIAVKEVAHRLGYQKTSNFIKIFKKHYDSSPGSLRKKAS